jgi:predicted glycosyltransferase
MTLAKNNKLVWIDLDNSPHVLFFDPIIRELHKRGIKTIITARDFAQVKDLLKLFDINAKIIGKHYGKNTILKMLGIVIRTLQLFPVAIKYKPDFAVSHGSRTQFLTSKILKIKVGVALDYEFIKMFPYLKADIVFAPQMISKEKITLPFKQIFQYAGIKEDVYVPSFNLSDIKFDFLAGADSKIVITIRPPAELAHYYSEKSKNLFEYLVNYLSSKENLLVIFTPRTIDQGTRIKNQWKDLFDSGKFIIPAKTPNGLDLLYHSDLVISGGGTMIREAAAMGIPAYSTFGSQIGSVDSHLQKTGRLTLLQSEEDILHKIKIVKRGKSDTGNRSNKGALKELIDKMIEII